MRFRGTESRTRSDIEKDLASLGAEVKVDLTRERDTLLITVEPSRVEQVFEIMADLYKNSTFEDNQLEAERESVHRDIMELQRDQFESTLESVHFTAYRDHQMSNPVLGVRENVTNITAGQLKDWVKNHQTGNNLVVVASGDVEHQRIAELTDKHFGDLSQEG